MLFVDQAKKVFDAHGGMMRTSDALAAGIHPRSLYKLRDLGIIERISRGLYRWADLPPLSDPDLVAVAARIPRGVICLISALAFHEITTQIPHEVHVAIPREVRVPRIDWPPIRGFRFSAGSYRAGIEEHIIDDTNVKIYSAAKTVADSFKFRNALGVDVAVEAIRLALEQGKAAPAEIEGFARVCRVDNVVGPYLEALL
jgi:predicted transcriptional regulator of viral defense system